MNSKAVPIYEIGNDPSYDFVYSYLFTDPGIVVLKDFPLSESRFRVLRESFSYEEIVEELTYCIGSRNSAEQLAWFIKDDLLTADAPFLYPEVIRVVVEASIATIVHDPLVKQRLSIMYPQQAVFCIPDEDYAPVISAFECLKKTWWDPRPNFPKHLQPLLVRLKHEVEKRLPGATPAEIRLLFDPGLIHES